MKANTSNSTLKFFPSRKLFYRHYLALVSLTFASIFLAGCAQNNRSTMQISEVGSMHVGGRPVTLSGLPVREIVYSASRPEPSRIEKIVECDRCTLF